MTTGLLHSHLHLQQIPFTVPMQGSSLIYVDTIYKKQLATHTKMVMQGRVQAFISEHGKKIGALSFYSRPPKAPFKLKPGCTYLVPKSQIRPLGVGNIYLKIDKSIPPIMTKGPSLLFKAKSHLKTWLRAYLLTPIKNPRTKALFSALLFGERPPESLSSFFKVCGMSHLLCISGLHLVLFFAACERMFSLCFKKPKRALLFAICLISIYTLALLPSSPSIGRAYLALLCYSFARFKQLPTTALNILALVFTLSLIMDPGQIVHIGFQLSYSATLALIWFLPFIQQQIAFFLPKRARRHIEGMPLISQLGFIALYFIKQLLAVNLAVTIFCAPLLFYHGLYPSLLSFFYNLLYPSLFAALILISYSCALIMLIIPPLKLGIIAILNRCFNSFFHLLIFFPKKLAVPFFFPINSPLLTVFLMLLLFLIPLPSFLKKQDTLTPSY